LVASSEEVAGIIAVEPLELPCLGRAGSAAVEPEGSACAGLAVAAEKVETERLTGQVVAEWPFGWAEQLLLFSIGLQELPQQCWLLPLEQFQDLKIEDMGTYWPASPICFIFSSVV
jgi:hypothetical protein